MIPHSLKKKIIRFGLVLFLSLLGWQAAQATEMAITVDDLPISGPLPPNMTRMDVAKQMLAVFKKHHIQGVYGMINGGTFKDPKEGEVLQLWVQDGQLLGNHTYTHANPNKISIEAYLRDIKRNDPILAKLMGGKNYKFFRYPFLAEGNTPQKRDAIRNYLFSQGYQIAPVTVDWADWLYNPPYVRCMKRNNQQAMTWLENSFLEQANSSLKRAQIMSQALFGRDIKQILLIHIGVLDARILDRLLTDYEKQGVTFIPLQVALNDPAYKIPISFADTKGFTFFQQAKRAKGIKTPKEVGKYYITFPEAQLASICK